MEEWRDIKGYEGLYKVSNKGRVKSLKYGKERILKGSIDGKGYLSVGLCKCGKRIFFKKHRLVAEYFLENPKNLPCINHKDEDKTNNRVDNLEYCTYKYNNSYGTRLDRISKSNKGKEPWNKGKNLSEETKQKMSKSHEKMVMAINKESGHIFIFQSITQASEELGINSGNISRCCNGELKSAGKYKWSYY